MPAARFHDFGSGSGSGSLVVSRLAARRFLRRILALDTPHPSIEAALAHHGYVQIDPINVCGRMHDLILRPRVAGYREGDLHRHIHSPARPGFEHYLPHLGILVAFPVSAWRHVGGLIADRRLRRGTYGRKLSPKAERIAQHILSEIARRGPLMSDEIEHEGRSRTAWGTQGRLVKNVLEVLLVHGRVLITARRNFRRVYDLPERVLPAQIRNAPRAAPAEVARWMALLRVRQRRLVTLTRDDLRLIADDVRRVEVEGCPPLYCLRDDVPALAAAAAERAPEDSAGAAPATLLAPLDPILYDRRLTSALWDFDYTWEVYTPAAKRVRGYYALPVLAGAELVGHVDVKADRAAGRLVVVSKRIRRGYAASSAVRALAGWLGLE